MVEVICEVCERSWSVQPHRTKTARYCSQKCKYEGIAARRARPLRERLWEKIDKRGEDDCWPWTAATTNGGYGVIGEGRARLWRATRLVYMECNGSLSDTDIVRHRCDNPPCCNPRHLVSGTHRENMNDKKVRGRANIQSRLTDDQIHQIITSPATVRAAAAEFGVSFGYVSMLRNGLRRAG